MKSTEKKRYYLGLDIGTDSVGYAATDPEYRLMKFKGEPTWGVTTFEAAQPAQTRRLFRTQRRRLDRRQQRVKLLEELFADEIAQIDPRFFIRRRESALLRKDKEEPFALFSDSTYTDREYAKKYPEFPYRLQVKAGLTGYAQVTGAYDTEPIDKLKMDLMYIEEYSLLLDIQILLLTLKTMLFPPENNAAEYAVRSLKNHEHEDKE